MILHLLLGYRELRESRYYRDDPLVKRLLGLQRLPDVATLSRMLKEADARSVANLRELSARLLFERLAQLGLPRITLDFDGSVQSTTRHAEGTAVGFNKKKKGARSYYPLFCTIAQTGQVLDFLHRSGNVHDSHGAREFILACIAGGARGPAGRGHRGPHGQRLLQRRDRHGPGRGGDRVHRERSLRAVRGTEREDRAAASGGSGSTATMSYFEESWKPQSWKRRFRFLFIRTLAKRQQKEPIQLDLFVPHEYGYDFKVIVTNKTLSPQKVVAFHEGRGSQEGIFGELKTHCQMGYVPVRKCLGNQMYLLAGLFAHNLLRELQMMTSAPSRRTTEKRTPLWAFEELHTFRAGLIQRAGRLTRPHGKLTLTISAGHWIKNRILDLLKRLQNAA